MPSAARAKELARAQRMQKTAQQETVQAEQKFEDDALRAEQVSASCGIPRKERARRNKPRNVARRRQNECAKRPKSGAVKQSRKSGEEP